MEKIIKIVLISLLTLIVVGLSYFLYKSINGDLSFNFNVFSHESNNLIDTKVFDSINNIDIKSDVADIYIKNNTDNNYKVEIYSDNVKNHVIDYDNNNLNIIYENGRNLFFSKSSRIIIYMPSTFNNNIKIVSTTGDIKIESFELANINIESNTGDTNIDNINYLDIKSNTGDLEINKINELNADIKTGDIESNIINKKFNIKTRTGDVDIEEISIKEDSYIDSNIGDININKINDIYVETESRVGDVKVNNDNRFSQIVLHIKTDVGDVKVN